MKKIYKMLSILVSIISLSSCTLKLNYNVFKLDKVPVTPLDPITVGESKMSTFQSVTSDGLGISYLPSIGEPNILVIPVDFYDYRFERGSISNEAVKANIYDGFFGEREESDLVESLSSYYEESSYGKLKIKGSVTDVITAPRSYAYYNTVSNSDKQISLIEEIIKTTLASYDDTTDFNNYDTDKNGYFDAIWMVYSALPNGSDDSMFWAFTTWTDMVNEYDGVRVSDFAWASYSFFSVGGYDKPDAHTFVHETGHLLGLDDFYNYDNYGATFPTYPVGQLDMMDYNIGDHMAFSKINLGWIDQQVYTDPGEYKLKPISSHADALVVGASGYNKSNPFWEYYVFEYYRPEGLNELDSKESYENGELMYSVPGLRVFHVNQKLSYINSLTMELYGDPITNLDTIDKQNYYLVYHSNTPSFSYADPLIPLVKLIRPEGYMPYRAANNNSLFRLNDNSSRALTDERWDTPTLNFSFTVTELTDDELTITFN